MADGPLAGINVLEFSVVVAGPATGMHLSDLGARVIKVEAPGGEPFRTNGAVVRGHGKAFTWLNHGKESIEIDVAHPQGRQAIHRLVPNIDVVVINFRPGVPERLGIDYQTLSAIRPDLIYVDITGFGSTGPLASRSASDIVAQAYGGAIALDGKSDEHGAPLPVALAVGDAPTGMAAAMAALAALYHRARTGEGQLVRASLLRTVLNLTGFQNMREPATDPVAVQPLLDEIERVRQEGGSYDRIVAARDEFSRRMRGTNLFYSGYRAKDGGIVLGALTPANREAFRQAIGITGDRHDEPGFDPRDPANLVVAETLREQVRQTLLTRTVQEWIDDLRCRGRTCSARELSGADRTRCACRRHVRRGRARGGRHAADDRPAVRAGPDSLPGRWPGSDLRTALGTGARRPRGLYGSGDRRPSIVRRPDVASGGSAVPILLVAAVGIFGVPSVDLSSEDSLLACPHLGIVLGRLVVVAKQVQ